MNHPDPKKHQYVSFSKSVIRILAGISLMMGHVGSAGLGLILAEGLGILEELV